MLPPLQLTATRAMVNGNMPVNIKLKGGGKKKRGRKGKKALAFNPQGTGRSVQVAFGRRGRKQTIPRGLSNRCWDAFDQCHAALPRSVGPYTVLRTTLMHKTTSKCILIGTFDRRDDAAYYGPLWSTTVIAEQSGADGLLIGTQNATKFFGVPEPGTAGVSSGTRVASTNQVCPAGISVQVMGNKSLNAAEGQLAACVIPAGMDLRGTDMSWQDVSKRIISYFRPRLLSGGKLALRGVQMNSHPLNMTDCSDFRTIELMTGEDAVPWNMATESPSGWAPMAIINEDASDITLLVSVEWRVRFDMGHPAVASHQHHGVTSDSAWDNHIKSAVAALPGVIDIVEKVAQTGMRLNALMG